ncbi:response regulator [Estrella lausannensis]|uniref:Two-component system, response regulator n=1 Tax=Estrella lausannensis TaxID=483423 RepID=A0A0H5DRQ3_9BACT|nr:response regulator [Estrella lausannensis]CRX38394.1 Two-component system, response regulator [Estrella lausannensis]
MKILVVDDEKATESLFTQRFKEEIKQGLFEFSFASSGEEALDKLSHQDSTNATLILSDINMPGISGLQLLKSLKNLYPEMPVMMVTAYGDEANHMKAMAYKADGFINKPIDFAALKDKIIKYGPDKESKGRHVPQSSVIPNKILVVDDEPALEALIRQKFRQQIKNNEMEFHFASNGVEALKFIEQDPDIGIILTDINMPEMDGLTFLSKLKEKKRLFRSIVISAYGDMENIRAAMNLGASDFITKPIDLKDLATTLEKITDQYNFLKEGAIAQNRIIEYKKELEIASYIQQTFIPHNFNPYPGNKSVEIFGKMFPAKEVSGDFFDFFPITAERLGFVIADVSGKGVPAALFMVMSKTLLRSTALTNPSPKSCVQQVSHYLCYNNESMMFVTSFYGVLNIKTGEVVYCDAGHHPPYILSADGNLQQIPKDGGIALGIIDDLEREHSLYVEKKIQLQKGDSIILFTDGVTEAINKKGEIYPKERLENLIRRHARQDFSLLVSNLKNDLTDFSEGQGQYDDITLLCIRWKGE